MSDSSLQALTASPKSHSWRWIPSLYFAEGLPYVVVMSVSVLLYKRLGISNTKIALYTSWLYLPWVIKPLWSPLVEVFKTRRTWIVLTQLLVGAGLAGVALTIPGDNFLRWTMAFFWLLAFSSATHDVAADGYYMLALDDHQQAWFVGVRSTFYRLAMIAGQGLLVMLAGYLEVTTGLPERIVEVRAVEGTTTSVDFSPRTLAPATVAGPQQLLAQNESIEIDLATMEQPAVDTLVRAVRDWNVRHGFYPLPEGATMGEPPQDNSPSRKPPDASSGQAEAGQPEAIPGSIPARDIRPPPARSGLVASIERLITDWFGPVKPAIRADALAGNCGVIYFRCNLPVPKGQSLVVLFGRGQGDASFQVIEGTRFVVTPENADQPFAAVVQLDHKMDRPSQATFVARSGNFPFAWACTFYVLAGFFLLVCLYHGLILPKPVADISRPDLNVTRLLGEFITPFVTFFQKKHLLIFLAFLLLYRFAEAQLAKLAAPFLVDAREVGGLGLTTGEVGFVYGTVGILMLTLGGLLGGFAAARLGLKYWIGWMVVAINLPNAAYIYLSQAMPENFALVNVAVGVEQFGYGFGFTAYMLTMLYIARGEHQTVHFALCTGLMALGMMIPGMFSGWLQELLGYQHFFIWVMLATIPGFLVTWLVPIDPQFGKKRQAEENLHEGAPGASS